MLIDAEVYEGLNTSDVIKRIEMAANLVKLSLTFETDTQPFSNLSFASLTESAFICHYVADFFKSLTTARPDCSLNTIRRWFPEHVLDVMLSSQNMLSGTYKGWTFEICELPGPLTIAISKEATMMCELQPLMLADGTYSVAHGYGLLQGDPALVHAELSRIFMTLKLMI